MLDAWKQSHPAFADGAAEPGWLADRRRAALARFEATGFPSTKLEAWKYTSTRAIQQGAFAHVAAPATDAVSDLVDAHRVAHAAVEVVLVDGVLAPDLGRGDADGVTVRPLSVALGSDDALEDDLDALVAWQDEAFSALNTAFLQDGLVIDVSAGADVAGPVHVIAVSTGADAPVAHIRHLVRVAKGARATVVETHLGTGGGASLTNVVVEDHVADNAELMHLLTGLAPDEAHLIHTLRGRVARDGRLRVHASWLGGAITRSDVVATIAGPGAEVHLDALYVLDGQQHVDNHTVIDHVVPHGLSRQHTKGVVGGKAKGIVDGLVIMRPDAQKSDAVQDLRNLLVSSDADANAKPTLEIYADDVKAAHGATVGQLDQGQLAYLRSRGIPLDEARQILTAAFVADRVDVVKDEALRERLRGYVEAKLEQLQEAS